jgi:hypothetical protein
VDGTQVVVAILGTLGVGTILGAVVTGLFNRRKLSADATEIITKAASGVVERLEAELGRKQAEHDAEVHALRADLDRVKSDWADEREAWRRVNQLHVAFDMLAIAKLAEAGIDLGMDPPPLLPPIRADLG